MSGRKVSIVVPVLNEAGGVADSLRALERFGCELVVVDGGSDDDTAAIAQSHDVRLVRSERGRSLQMNAGAAVCSGDVLLFVHADTRLPPEAIAAIDRALTSRAWGRFDVWLDSSNPWIRLVGRMMNLRSRLTGIATGDQAIFVSRQAWDAARGYAPIELMEDIDLSRRLKRLAGRPACLREVVRVSARRWERHGVLRTILVMWWLRLRYFLGASPADLHRSYYGARPASGDAARGRA